jgi:hypothetical protein
MASSTLSLDVRTGKEFEVATILELFSTNCDVTTGKGYVEVTLEGVTETEEDLVRRFARNLCYVERVRDSDSPT